MKKCVAFPEGALTDFGFQKRGVGWVRARACASARLRQTFAYRSQASPCSPESRTNAHQGRQLQHGGLRRGRLRPRAGRVEERARGAQRPFRHWTRDPPALRILVVSLYGDAPQCPVREANLRAHGSTTWKHGQCDVVARWDGTRFVYRMLVP
jgi:hypothetical protein